MTAGEALARCAELRPGCEAADETRRQWLREADGMLRARFFDLSDTNAYDEVGADVLWGDEGLADSAVLLAPAPFDAMYPHYLCARVDAALGENDRYTGEQNQYNALLSELAAWLRRHYAPKSRTALKW